MDKKSSHNTVVIRKNVGFKDLPHILRLLPFVYGLYTIVYIANNYQDCDENTSAFNVTFCTWIFTLSFVHFNISIQSWFQMIIECFRMMVVAAFTIWGFVRYDKYTNDDCDSVMRDKTLELSIIGLIIVLAWIIWFMIRFFFWFKDHAGTPFKFNVSEWNELVIRLIIFSCFVVLFSIVAASSDTDVSELWFTALILSTTMIELSVSTFFWKYETFIQPIIEGIFLLWIFVWCCIGWNSYRTVSSDIQTDTTGNTGAFILAFDSALVILWIISYGFRFSKFVRDYQHFIKTNQQPHSDTSTSKSSSIKSNLDWFFPSHQDNQDLEKIKLLNNGS